MHARIVFSAGILWLAIVQAGAAEEPLDLGGVTERHVMIPMRDGTKLSAYLYFPPGDGPWPVLYEQRYARLTDPSTRKAFARLAAGGYVVAAENFRGAQLSEGGWVGYRALGWGKLRDGYDTVEWLAAQPWSTGKIGTFGSSPPATAFASPWPARAPRFTSRSPTRASRPRSNRPSAASWRKIAYFTATGRPRA